MRAVSVQCPSCGWSSSVDESLIGRTARCKRCGNSCFLTPSVEVAAAEPTQISPQVSGASQDTRSSAESGLTPAVLARATLLPEKIGRFIIKERLGAGACGSVYRAADPTLERDVALKVPHPEFQRDERAIERFLPEARAAGKLQHPHVVTVFEAGTDGETSYIASALIVGRSLADAIDEGPFDPGRAARIVGALAEALHAAHLQGIIHRDVKPSNVLLDAEDRPHLTDFGMARLAADGTRLTKVGSILGTPAYLSPEQARGHSDKAEAASDQYSLGVTLYELLCGQVPFAGPLDVVIFNTLHTLPPSLRDERPEVPPELESICLKALAKKAEDRYANCSELATDLAKWLGNRPTSLMLGAPAPGMGASDPGCHEPTALRRTSIEETPRLPSTVMDGQQPDRLLIAPGKRRTLIGRFRLPSRRSMITGVVALLAPSLGLAFYVASHRARMQVTHIEQGPITKPAAPTNRQIPSDTRPGELSAELKAAALPAATDHAPALAGDRVVKPSVHLAAAHEKSTSSASAPIPPATPEKSPSPAVALNKEQSRRTSYANAMKHVEWVIGTKDFEQASRLLASCPEDLRGWEWHYCRWICELGPQGAVANDASNGPAQGALAEVPIRVNKLGWIRGASFSPDGTRIACTVARTQANVTHCWLLSVDAATGQTVKSVEVYRGKHGKVEIPGVAYSPEGKTIATGTIDGRVRIFDAVNLRMLHVYEVATSSPSSRSAWIHCVAYSPDGRLIVAACDDGRLHWWSADAGTSVKTGSTSASKRTSPASNRSRQQDEVAPWSATADGQRVGTLVASENGGVPSVAWDPLGRWIATGGPRMTLWELKSGQQLFSIAKPVHHIAVSPDGFKVAWTALNRELLVCDVATQRLAATLSGPNETRYLAFSPDGSRVATLAKWNVELWDVSSGSRVFEFVEPRDVSSYQQYSWWVSFSPDGRRLAAAGPGALRIWSIPQAVNLRRPSVAAARAIDTSLGADSTPAANALAPDNDFRALFNGKDLSGWTPMKISGPNDEVHEPDKGGWAIEEGAIVCRTSRSGWLKCDGQHGDFVLRIEYKLSPRNNSGIYIRAPAPRGFLTRTGMEVQLVDEDMPPYELSAEKRTGAIMFFVAASANAAHPAGEWNELEIRCDGDAVEVHLNGTRVVAADMTQVASLRDRPRFGFIGLANHGGQADGTAFRNIRLKALTAH